MLSAHIRLSSSAFMPRFTPFLTYFSFLSFYYPKNSEIIISFSTLDDDDSYPGGIHLSIWEMPQEKLERKVAFAYAKGFELMKCSSELCLAFEDT